MKHKHGRGQAIRKRMSKIMRESNVVAKRLPTEEARKDALTKQEEKTEELESN